MVWIAETPLRRTAIPALSNSHRDSAMLCDNDENNIDHKAPNTEQVRLVVSTRQGVFLRWGREKHENERWFRGRDKVDAMPGVA